MNRTHSMTRTPEYQTWQRMKARCYYSKGPRFKDYGGRGIRVCAKWLNDFQAFLADARTASSGQVREGFALLA